MAEGGGGSQSPATLFQARLKTDLAGVSSTLTLNRYQGDKVVVSGVTVVIPSGGLTRDVADNLISGTGTDSGAAGAASTLYYVYVSNARASFSPSSIRLSATAPSLVNGVKYLGAAGNALNWRFVGWVRLNATPQFESSLTARLIVNYYNRLRLPLMANPAYVDDNAVTTYTVSSVTYVELNGGVGARVNFISNGEDETHLNGIFLTQVGAGFSALMGIGIDTVGGPEQCAIAGNAGINTTEATAYDEILAEGFHFAALLALSNNGTPYTFFADFTRDGGAHDPRGTMVRGFING